MGIHGNEDADKLAKQATSDPHDINMRILFSNLNQNYKSIATDKTNEKITSLGLSKGKEYFQNYYTKNRKPWFKSLKLDRKTIVTINRCPANHYNLAASLSRINIIKSPQCPCTNPQQDLTHIL